MNILTDHNGLLLEAAAAGTYRLSYGALVMEFRLPCGRLEIGRIARNGADGQPSGGWSGVAPEPEGGDLCAEGEPVFTVRQGADGRPQVAAVWSDGASSHKWVITLNADPACVECHMEVSCDRLRPIAAAGLGSGNGSTAESTYVPVEKLLQRGKSVAGADLLATVAMDGRHLRLTAVQLHDITDYFDHLVEERTVEPGHRGAVGLDGNLLLCSDQASGEHLLLVRMAPTPEAEFSRCHEVDFEWVHGSGVAVYGTGLQPSCSGGLDTVTSYGLLVMPVTAGDPIAAWRAYYRQRMQPEVCTAPLCLGNTWGDRNQDAALNEAFVQREIAALQRTGLRGLMLDDGWQAGVTANSKLQSGGVWEGYHATDEGFWSIHAEKFPRGLEPVVAAAAAAGKELALWFSPDSADDFANWEKDATVLLGLFQRHGIRSFKLDGIKLRTRLGEARFGRFLDALEHGSGGRIVVVLDVTSEVRQGYFREIEHGVLFLENRYTDWGNYYPYRTLRNVWQLSRWIPSQRLHIECLNPRRNASVYGGDPFSPQRYPISYLYAITMIGHPLAWMEVQHLDAADSAALHHVADWHAANHQRLLTADIQPVGELPNGRSWTGFRFAFPDGHCGLLVFRDSTEREESVFTIDHAGPFIQRAGNTEATTGSLPRGRLRLRLPARRSWAFLETATTSSA